MEEQRPAYLNEIPQEDWEKTPASVKKLVEEMAQRLDKLEQQLELVLAVQQQLLEKINRTSKNSSSSPSQDPPSVAKKPRKAKSGKKRGGQPGQDYNRRNLYSVEECSSVIDHHPETCACCGEKLLGEDTHPFKWRHFQGEIILLYVRWYLRYPLSYRNHRRDDAGTGTNRRPYSGVSVGPGICAGTGQAMQSLPETD